MRRTHRRTAPAPDPPAHPRHMGSTSRGATTLPPLLPCALHRHVQQRAGGSASRAQRGVGQRARRVAWGVGPGGRRAPRLHLSVTSATMGLGAWETGAVVRGCRWRRRRARRGRDGPPARARDVGGRGAVVVQSHVRAPSGWRPRCGSARRLGGGSTPPSSRRVTGSLAMRAAVAAAVGAGVARGALERVLLSPAAGAQFHAQCLDGSPAG
jgi:hypothetical protein